MEYKEAIVISAMFDCGKSYFSQNNKKYNVFDLDELIEYKLCKERKELRSITTKKQLYIDLINENKHKYDIILININASILNELNRNKIKYILCYPENTYECFREWVRRDMEREKTWKWPYDLRIFQQLVRSLERENNALFHFKLNKTQYLSDIIDDVFNIYIKLNELSKK